MGLWTTPAAVHCGKRRELAGGRACQRCGVRLLTVSRRGGGEGRGGSILVLTGGREATETAGDEREQETAVAISVERLGARR
jgi:hypothetical protein